MINIFEPQVYPETITYLEEVHKSKWLGKGKLVELFEDELRGFLGVKNVSTASCASHIIEAIIRVSDFSRESNIIIPNNSFPVIPSVILSEGIECRVADIEPLTGNICIKSVEKLIDKKTAAVFLTHYGGIPVDIQRVRDLVGRDVKIIEDSATALGSQVGEVMVGARSDFSLWSFDAMKLLVAGEGGCFTSIDDDLFNAVRSHLYLGLDTSEKSGLDKASSETSTMWWEYQPHRFGTRSVFTNIQAAYGLSSLRKIEKRLERQKEIRSYYENYLTNVISFLLQGPLLNGEKVKYSNYFFTLKISSCKRNSLAKFLKDAGVYTTLRYHPVSDIQFYAKQSVMQKNYEGSDEFYSECLNIPIHAGLSEKNLQQIVKSIKQYLNA
jgi:dTDP-4-amino-4,6-dideoxygalactose transaminase